MSSTYFSKKTKSKKLSSDTGMAMVLICLLIGYFTDNVLLYNIAIPLLLINMIAPICYYPLSIIWFGIAEVIGSVMSKIILSLVYLFMVIPVGLVQKLFGKDALMLSKFKKDKTSVMKTRNYKITPTDFNKPF